MTPAPGSKGSAYERAFESGGSSNSSALYRAVGECCLACPAGGLIVDIGCGKGALFRHVCAHVDRYLGIDIVRYADFPADPKAEFREVNLDDGRIPLPDGCADVVCSLETIEHVENPRAFSRELVRIAKPGGRIVVTTPNQLSFASKVFLLAKNEFMHFQERPGLYPAHISALLDVDLLRIARENGLVDVDLRYTGDGRMPLTARSWPKRLGHVRGWRGRAFSDNVVVAATKPRL